MRFSLALLPGLLASACAPRQHAIEVCTQELRIYLAPRDTTLVVGESFRPRVHLASCGGRRHLTDSVVWKLGDAGIATVDSASGLVTARAPGETVVTGIGVRYGELGRIRLLVRVGSP
jgi:hypothetical protein